VLAKKVNKNKPLIIVRRIIDERGQHKDTEIDIKNNALCEVLIDINKDVRGISFTKSQPTVSLSINRCVSGPIVLQADRDFLFHSLAGLRKTKENADVDLIEDIDILLRFIDEDYGDTIADCEHLISTNQITFNHLWALFPPNTLVYRYHDVTEQHQVLLYRRMSHLMKDEKGIYVWLTCDFITDDGSAFGLAREHFVIRFFKGTSKIQDLPVYPLQHNKDWINIRESAICRGKKFASIVPQLFEVSGPACEERRSFGERPETKIYKSNSYGRVMIDPTVFRLFEPNNIINTPVYSALEERKNLKDEEYLICTPVVLGFCLGTKMWGGFALDRLRDVVWSGEAFAGLVLGEKQKRLVHALVQQHSMPRPPFDDIVAGKGKGLVGLLCGNPGCGKTLTAEAVAEVLHRPLYVVSAGELGTSPVDVDKNLARILELANTWKAVLLLDEAEVFLHKRSLTDLTRNALVSIFLRQLEYYQGVLILTTNMITQCDPAFESRIHFCITYPDLDFASRKTIWKTFFSKALKNPDDINEEDINKLAERKLNGRQIKNAVSSAQSIASAEGSRLLVEHIETVLDVLNDWQIGHSGSDSYTQCHTLVQEECLLD